MKIEYIIKYNNKNESRLEREFKYTLCKVYFSVKTSRCMCDWTYGHIATRINTASWLARQDDTF